MTKRKIVTATMMKNDGDPIVHIDVTLVTRKRTNEEDVRRSAIVTVTVIARGIATATGRETVSRGRGDTGTTTMMTSRASGTLRNSTVLNILKTIAIACHTGHRTDIGRGKETESQSV